MARTSVNLFWSSLFSLCAVLLIGQDCLAQCDPDPCQSIANAIADSCTEIGGSCTGPSDYLCSCDSGYNWQAATHTCEEAAVDPCDPDPCESILNAVPGSCAAVGGDDFICDCDSGYAWQDVTNTCEWICIDDNDCGLCQQCSAGDCVNQAAGEDIKEECSAISCTNLLYGWSGSSCRRFAASTALNGNCDGSGTCASVEQSCEGIGTVTATCGSDGCKMACPTGGVVSLYDSIPEVCFTDFAQHDCAPGLVCDPTGTCN